MSETPLEPAIEAPAEAPKKVGRPRKEYGAVRDAVIENAHKFPPHRKSWKTVARELGISINTVYTCVQRCRDAGTIPAYRPWHVMKRMGSEAHVNGQHRWREQPEREERPQKGVASDIPDDMLARAAEGKLTAEDLHVALDRLIVGNTPEATKARAIEIKAGLLVSRGEDWGPPPPSDDTAAEEAAASQLAIMGEERLERAVARARAKIMAEKEAMNAPQTQEAEADETSVPDPGIGEMA